MIYNPQDLLQHRLNLLTSRMRTSGSIHNYENAKLRGDEVIMVATMLELKIDFTEYTRVMNDVDNYLEDVQA